MVLLAKYITNYEFKIDISAKVIMSDVLVSLLVVENIDCLQLQYANCLLFPCNFKINQALEREQFNANFGGCTTKDQKCLLHNSSIRGKVIIT